MDEALEREKRHVKACYEHYRLRALELGVIEDVEGALDEALVILAGKASPGEFARINDALEGNARR